MRRALPLLLVLSAGCAGLSDFARSAVQTPKATFKSVSVSAFDLEGVTLDFVWDVQNPNGFGLDLASVGWSVDAEGQRVAAGEAPGGVKIVANGTSPVTFPVRVRFRDVPGIASLLTSGKDRIHYKLAATLGLRTPIGVLDVPLSREDQVRLPGLPRFSVEGISLHGVSLEHVTFEVRLRVKNPNAFPMPAGALDYALAIAGSQVAKADGAQLAAVPASGSAVVAIPVKLDFASAGRAAVDVARGGDVDVGLAGKASVAGIPLPLDLKGRVSPRR
jgi:LEA14-like dessication related protein